MDGKALPGVGINHRQGPEPLAVEQGVGHEVYRPDLVRLGSQRPLDPACRHDVAPWTLRAQVQAFLTVETTHTLVVHRPTLPP